MSPDGYPALSPEISFARLSGSYFAPNPMAAVSQMKWSTVA